MIYTTKELLKNGETQYSIKIKLNNRKLFLIQRGLYSDSKSNYIDEGYICKKYPKAVLTGLSAYAIYDLTDFIPDKFYLSTEQHSFPIRRKDVVQTYQDPSFFSVGIIEMDTDDGKVRIYDLERLLIETIRLKERIAPDLYNEVIKSYRKIGDKLDYFKLNNYLKKFKNGKRLGIKIIEVI